MNIQLILIIFWFGRHLVWLAGIYDQLDGAFSPVTAGKYGIYWDSCSWQWRPNFWVFCKL